jgi:PTS system mannose-specific IIB component/fructoselysine and glucoselysine-specific PTS system IIB component
VSVELARVDDRLVHGQVLLGWGRAMRAVRILVVDDELAADPWEREMVLGLAGDIGIEILPIAEAPARLAAEAARAGAAIVLFRSPRTALSALAAGAPLEALNLGGLHFAPGKARVLDYVYLDAADREALAAIAARGVRVSAQDVPAARPVALAELLDAGRGA